MSSTSALYTLSLHDALPIFAGGRTERYYLPATVAGKPDHTEPGDGDDCAPGHELHPDVFQGRSEEHTSELQSRPHLVCRLLLEKKNDQSTFAASRYRDYRLS